METPFLAAHHAHQRDEVIRIGWFQIRFLLTGSETNGRVAIFEMTIPSGVALSSFAQTHDEICYGLDGTITWTVNGTTIDVEPHQTLYIPSGAAHAFANQGHTEAKVLLTLLPGVIGPAFFYEIREAMLDTAHCRATITPIMRRHGLSSVSQVQNDTTHKSIFPSSPPSWHGFA
jgi:quercetin dioxygenase-like cupin family protein